MTRPENASLNSINDAGHYARLDRVARMIEPSPWLEQSEPPKSELLYHVERYGDGYVTAYEGTDLLAVMVYCKGAKEMMQRMEALKRDNKKPPPRNPAVAACP
jgi:acetyl-CoA carboxylase carboxyltransferase component